MTTLRMNPNRNRRSDAHDLSDISDGGEDRYHRRRSPSRSRKSHRSPSPYRRRSDRYNDDKNDRYERKERYERSDRYDRKDRYERNDRYERKERPDRYERDYRRPDEDRRRKRPDYDQYRGKTKTPKIEGSLTLWIGNISDNTTESDIRNCFEKKCRSSDVVSGVYVNSQKHFAHVRFTREEFLEEIVKLSGVEVDELNRRGRLRVDYAEDKPHLGGNRPEIPREIPSHTTTIFVGNLDINISKEDVESLFSQCGQIEHVNLKRNDYKKLAYAHVKFTSNEAVVNAVNQFSGYELNGNRIRVDWAEEKKREETTRGRFDRQYDDWDEKKNYDRDWKKGRREEFKQDYSRRDKRDYTEYNESHSWGNHDSAPPRTDNHFTNDQNTVEFYKNTYAENFICPAKNSTMRVFG